MCNFNYKWLPNYCMIKLINSVLLCRTCKQDSEFTKIWVLGEFGKRREISHFNSEQK